MAQNENEIPKVEGEVVAEGAKLAPVKAEMEFRLINPTEGGFLKRIEWNRDELEAAVKAKAAEYEGITYTDDTIQAAKADRAELNKLKAAIEDRRKIVKKVINEPYTVFEKELKDITALIEKPVSDIDKQIKDYENQKKEEKKGQIREAYSAAIGELEKVIPFEKLFDPRYLNATYSLQKAIADIQGKVEKVKTDLQTIDEMCSDYKTNAQDVYLKTLDLSKAMAEEKRLRELKEKMEADRRAKEEAERRRIEQEEQRRQELARRQAEEAKRREAERQAAQERAAAQASQAEPASSNGSTQAVNVFGSSDNGNSQDNNRIGQNVPQNAPNDTENTQNVPENTQSVPESAQAAPAKRYRATFWCEGTLEEIKALGAYMREHNMTYGKVGK
ncbi:MAG: DUF1351 domain-containing protein [Lachnospiraceae bacterium]